MATLAKLGLEDLTPEQIAKFGWWRCDQLYEKHESWGNWQESLKYQEGYLIEVSGHPILLPHLPEDPTKLHVDDYTLSADGVVMTIFLKDFSYIDNAENPSSWDLMTSGYVAICYRVEGEEFYVAVVYHARYVVPGPMNGSPKQDWYSAK